MEQRICIQCLISKPLTNYKNYYKKCKECQNNNNRDNVKKKQVYENRNVICEACNIVVNIVGLSTHFHSIEHSNNCKSKNLPISCRYTDEVITI